MNQPDTREVPFVESGCETTASASVSDLERHADSTQMLCLELTRTKPYERNPRRTNNPAYARIKASIRAEGMTQPLVVTRRPGENDYLVAAGGNTRLQILRELHAETGDERFSHVQCLYRPWVGEADVLLAHLKENDLRGELSFLDKAQAVVEAKRLIAAENETDGITQTQIAEVLKARGYGLSQGRISQLEYTVETLLPLLPQALEAGLGRPQVERIRRLERTARGIWSERLKDDDYDSVFAALCHRYDAPEWDIDNLRQALETEIAERAGISIHVVRMELDMRLARRRGEGAPEMAADARGSTITDEGRPASVSDVATADVPAVSDSSPGEFDSGGRDAEGISPSSGDGYEPGEDNESEPIGFAPEDLSMQDLEEPSSSGLEIFIPEATAEAAADLNLAAPTDLKSLRARAWTLARRLAQRHGIGELIAPLGDKGLGFLLRDVPDPALTEALDEDALAQVSAVWWVLAACSEITVEPLDHLLPVLEDGSILKQALGEQDAQLLFGHVWTLDPGHMGHRLWRRLDDRGWRELVDLMETYRQIHRSAEETGVSLWGSPR